MNEWMNNYSYRLGTSEHDKKWGVKRHMWTPQMKKWELIDPLDPVAPRPLPYSKGDFSPRLLTMSRLNDGLPGEKEEENY